jgi:hypothetical protein
MALICIFPMNPSAEHWAPMRSVLAQQISSFLKHKIKNKSHNDRFRDHRKERKVFFLLVKIRSLPFHFILIMFLTPPSTC